MKAASASRVGAALLLAARRVWAAWAAIVLQFFALLLFTEAIF
jgi:hypothetical protein